MGISPPVLPGSASDVETPIDRALSLALAGEHDAALRWAAAIVKADPAMPTALCLTGRLLGELGRNEAAREACTLAVARAIDIENLPLAVAAAREIGRFGADPGPQLDRIAEAFCKGSARLGEGSPPPPPLAREGELQPLASALTGMALIGKATEIIHEAKRALAAVEISPGIAAQPLFSTMSVGALRELLGALEPVWVPQGGEVIRQGSIGSEAYFVARGELEVSREREGQSMVLARLSNGAIVGEMALLSRAPRTGSVAATRPSIVLSASRESFDRLAVESPEVARELAAHCRGRMVENLARISDVLRAVPASGRAALIERLAACSYEKDEVLVTQDDAAPGMFFIASGEVAVVRRDPESGERLALATLGAGDVVGEVAMVLRRRASADIVALHPTVALFLPASEFMGLIHEHPAILFELYRIAVERDEETRSILSEETMVAADFILI